MTILKVYSIRKCVHVTRLCVCMSEHESCSVSVHLEDSTCPPAALCCQVEPEGLALITGKRLSVTLMQDVTMASPGQGRTGHLAPCCCIVRQ